MEKEKKNGTNDKQRRKKHEMTDSERNAVLQALLERSKDRVLHRGAIKQVADLFGIERHTVGRLWSRALSSSHSNLEPMDVSSRKHRSGRKKKDLSLQLEKIASIPLEERGTLRSIAAASGIPMTTLYNRLKAGEIRPRSNDVKPIVKDENNTDELVEADEEGFNNLHNLKINSEFLTLIGLQLAMEKSILVTSDNK